MIIKRFITFVIALSLAFSVSTAMAGKSDKSDKSGKSWNHSEKSDKSDKSRKGKRGKKGKNSDKSGKSDKSDKSGKSDKSDKSDKSEKSGKSDKEPPSSCFSDWDFSAGSADPDSGAVETGMITGTACTFDEVSDILIASFGPVGPADSYCFVDEEISDIPNLEVEGPYELNLTLTCSTDVPPPPPPPAD